MDRNARLAPTRTRKPVLVDTGPKKHSAGFIFFMLVVGTAALGVLGIVAGGIAMEVLPELVR